MSKLIESACLLLQKMYDPQQALFSYTTIVENGIYQNDFSYPWSLRYTINSHLGLQEAQRNGFIEWDSQAEIDRFLALHEAQIKSAADQGLLLAAATRASSSAAGRIFQRVKQLTAQKSGLLELTLQDVSWLLLGLIEYSASTHSAEALSTTEKLFQQVDRYFLNKDSMLPYYQLSAWRKPFSNFGGIVYFLQAFSEYARRLKSKYAEVIFRESVAKMIHLQGPNGEWPWFFNASSGVVADYYPVYSVHQDSMAMLFLLPAVDLGVAGASQAVEKSYRWLFGANQLGATMMVSAPEFFIYRCIHRRERLQRMRRYGRALLGWLTGGSARLARPDQLEVLRHGRSYHPGWILYAWASRTDFSEFTQLEL